MIALHKDSSYSHNEIANKIDLSVNYVCGILPLLAKTEVEFVLFCHNEHEVLAIEVRSQHPLAEAIVRHAESLGLKPQPAGDFQAIPAKEQQRR